jgi:regulator of RNase E activity RraA
MVIYPDDLLHGDLNGVTTIPRSIVLDLAAIGDEFVAAEGVILEALRGETPSIARLTQARAESEARIAALRKRVARTQ